MLVAQEIGACGAGNMILVPYLKVKMIWEFLHYSLAVGALGMSISL